MMHEEYEALRNLLDQQLNLAFPDSCADSNPIFPVMKYGVTTPGKRIRGVLLVAICDRLSVCREESLPFAVALEMIHAYSLVHDDMPEMDNDDFRRGLPTCHSKFGPALALLAGDGILNYSMEYLLSYRSNYRPAPFMDAMDALYAAAGGKGMLGGQVLDKLGEKQPLSLEELLLLHRRKTGALLLAPAAVAQALSGKNGSRYLQYCEHLGLAFQIKDDLLDIEGNQEALGKRPGKDALEHKSTFVSLLGAKGARAYLNQELAAAQALAGQDSFLCWLAAYTGSRNK